MVIELLDIFRRVSITLNPAIADRAEDDRKLDDQNVRQKARSPAATLDRQRRHGRPGLRSHPHGGRRCGRTCRITLKHVLQDLGNILATAGGTGASFELMPVPLAREMREQWPARRLWRIGRQLRPWSRAPFACSTAKLALDPSKASALEAFV